MKNNYFSDTLKKAGASGVKMRSNQSLNWFKQYITKTARGVVTDINDVRSMVKNSQKVRRIEPGKMYMFAYDAKHKATLPYWDASPLIFPFAEDNTHFYGINFHYLPVTLRAKLMDGLYTFLTDEQLTANTKLQFTYNLLKSASTFKYVKPCVKMYLKSNVRSRLIEIPADYWEIALFLPTAEWQGPDSSKVYSDSQRIIQGRK